MTERRTVERRKSDKRYGEKVPCPACGWLESKVIPRHLGRMDDGFARLRECQNPACQVQFRTIERAA